jgi:hypothetical protein
MGKTGAYRTVIVESFMPQETSGRHGPVHIRPIPGQVFTPTLLVECSKRLSDVRKYPLGTKFRLNAKLTDRLGGTSFLYAYHGDADVPITDEEANSFIAGLSSGHI